MKLCNCIFFLNLLYLTVLYNDIIHQSWVQSDKSISLFVEYPLPNLGHYCAIMNVAVAGAVAEFNMHQESGIYLLCWRTCASPDWWLVEKMSKFCFCITKRSCWLGFFHNQPLRLDSVQARRFPTVDIVFTLNELRGHGPMLSKSAAKKEETWPASIIWKSKVFNFFSISNLFI